MNSNDESHHARDRLPPHEHRRFRPRSHARQMRPRFWMGEPKLLGAGAGVERVPREAPFARIGAARAFFGRGVVARRTGDPGLEVSASDGVHAFNVSSFSQQLPSFRVSLGLGCSMMPDGGSFSVCIGMGEGRAKGVVSGGQRRLVERRREGERAGTRRDHRSPANTHLDDILNGRAPAHGVHPPAALLFFPLFWCDERRFERRRRRLRAR